MITGQPASATHVGMPSAMPILIRELTAIAERALSQPWAIDMIVLLCQANALVSEAQDLKVLPTSDVGRLRTRYGHHPHRSRQSSLSPPSWHPRADQTIPSLQPHSAAARAPQRGPALPHRPARSLRQQPGRTRPAKAQTQAESLRLFPLRNRRRCLCHRPAANSSTIFSTRSS